MKVVLFAGKAATSVADNPAGHGFKPASAFNFMLRNNSILALTVVVAAGVGTVAFATDTNTNVVPASPLTSTNLLVATNLFPKVEPSPNDIVAQGRNLKVTRGALDNEVNHAKWQMIARGDRPLLKEQEDEMARQILEQLINVNLIISRATKNDLAAGKEKTAKRLADARTKAGSEAAFMAELQRLHITTNELTAKWTDAVTADTVLKRELNINVSDAQVKKFYDDYPQKFKSPERIRIRMILVDSVDRKTKTPLTPDQQAAQLKRAEALLKRAKAGEDFAKLARENSDDPVSRDKGGEYIFGHAELPAEIDEAAFALKVGEISGLVSSKYGYHIIKLEEKFPPRNIPFNEAEADLKSAMVSDAIMEKFPAYIAALRREAEVKILDPKLLPPTTTDPKAFLRPDPNVKPK